MKFISILILSLFIISCECVNEVNTAKENIPEQNSNLNLVNLSSKHRNIKVYSNDIFIEEKNYNSFESESKKYISGNSIVNIRKNDEILLVNSVELFENQNYIAFVYDFNSSLLLQYAEKLIDNNLRFWNFTNSALSIKLFNANTLESVDISSRKISKSFSLNQGVYTLNYTVNNLPKEITFEIKQNKKLDICFSSENALKFEY